MGRWLSKKEYRKRGLRIVKLRYKNKLEFTKIAERMGILTTTVERCYYQFKGEYMRKEEKCWYCEKGFEGDGGCFYVDKGAAGVVRAHKTCHEVDERAGETNILVKVIPGRGEPSYGTKFMKGRR